MCIICYKPEGIDMPSDEEIKRMFNKNKDGAGFAIQGDINKNGGYKVIYRKGFMNIDDLLEALGPKESLKDFGVALHFRIKTHGKVNPATTHPTPITSNYGEMKKLSGEGPVVFHNGVFSGFGGIIDEESSDTQDFVAGVVTRYLQDAREPKKLAKSIVENLAGVSRVLVMYPNKKHPITKFGDWIESEGRLYSNSGFKADPIYSAHSYSSYNTFSYNQRDEYGCNIYERAWPSKGETWIRFETEARMNQVLRQAKSQIEVDGETFYEFYNEDTIWHLDKEHMEIYTDEAIQAREIRDIDESFPQEDEEDDYIEDYTLGISGIKREYLMFEDALCMEDYATTNWHKMSDYMYADGRDIWYLDVVNLEAYTDLGIKKFFHTGEQGHVKNKLIKEGYYEGVNWYADREDD